MEDWIAEVVGKMHIHKIKQSEIAQELGYTKEYINLILNGKRSPSNARDMIASAIEKIIQRRG